jgi:serine/threonine-protein kinase
MIPEPNVPSPEPNRGGPPAIDTLLVSACRLGLDVRATETPDMQQKENFLSLADRTALEALGANLGSRIISQFDFVPDASGDRRSTTLGPITATLAPDGGDAAGNCEALLGSYDAVLHDREVQWVSDFQLTRRLGAGGQGVVFLTEYRGFDGFSVPVALKVFSPEPYRNAQHYEEAMRRMAHVASLVAQIHHENLLDVHKFDHRDRIRMMIMEWIDGYDLRRLLVSALLYGVRARVSSRRWEYINRVIVTDGPEQPRLKAGVAVDIIRDCLAGLAALHRAEIVHGDIKPSNIMLRPTGHAKIIDIGSAFRWHNPTGAHTYTPAYAAPEVLEHRIWSPQSDLASLGYVLVELLSGHSVFAGLNSEQQLLEAKRSLPRRLDEIFPEEVTECELLMNFCRRLIAPDPNQRFHSAEEADLHSKEGASEFYYQLVRGDLASVFHNDLRIWIEAVKEWDEARGIF